MPRLSGISEHNQRVVCSEVTADSGSFGLIKDLFSLADREPGQERFQVVEAKPLLCSAGWLRHNLATI